MRLRRSSSGSVCRGRNPFAGLEADRGAKTVADLVERFLREHSERKNRTATTALYRGMFNRWILPKLKHLKVAEVTFSDVDGLHAWVTKEGGPYAGNRMLAALSKAFNLAIKWQWRMDNPVQGVERNQEVKCQGYMSYEEIASLIQALEEHPDRQAAISSGCCC